MLAPGQLWPTPNTAQATTHYWLQRPLRPATSCIAAAFYPYGTNGLGTYLVHHGADFPGEIGRPVYAAGPGTIVVAGDDQHHVYGGFTDFYGNLVVEEMDRRYENQTVYVLYGHLSRVLVSVGQRIDDGEQVGQHVDERGQAGQFLDEEDPVGEVGMAGIAMGPHLHMEVRVGADRYDATRNPEFWLQLLPGRGSLVGRLLTEDGRLWPSSSLRVMQAKKPGKTYQMLYTYVNDPQIHPDDQWGETFLWADAPAGDYLLETPWDEQVPFHINAGGTTFLDLRHQFAEEEEEAEN